MNFSELIYIVSYLFNIGYMTECKPSLTYRQTNKSESELNQKKMKAEKKNVVILDNEEIHRRIRWSYEQL